MLSLSLAALLLAASAPTDAAKRQVCVEEQVQCLRAPCPPVRVCRPGPQDGRQRPLPSKFRNAR